MNQTQPKFSKFSLFCWTTIISIVLITTYLRWAAVKDYNFAVTHDQGRDFMAVASIVIGHRPVLVGPTTSINGIFLGPLLYYFLIPPFILGAGNPQWFIYWQIFWYQLAGLGWYLIFRLQPSLALLVSGLFLLMPVGFVVNRYYWSANLMPAAIAWWLIALFFTLDQPSKIRIAILGLVSGLTLQLEAALGIIIFPFIVIYLFLLKKIPIRKFLTLINGFLFTLTPQFLYELIHNFSQTKILISELSGQAGILGQQLSFPERIINRWQLLLQLIKDTNHLPPSVVVSLFILSLVILLITYRKFSVQSQSIININLGLLILAMIFYLIFPQSLKSWYIHGLTIPMIMIMGVVLYDLTRIKFLKTAPIWILIITIFFTVKEQTKYLRFIHQLQSQDPSNFSNQIQVVDQVYQLAQGRGFWVYNYRPEIYDYPNQYSFWWYGTKKYGYQPEKITYADQVPPYVKSQEKLWTKTKPTAGDFPIFLIIEPDHEHPERQLAWLNNFQSLCTYYQQAFPWGTQIQLRKICQM